MFIGSYTQKQIIWITATIHRFETGQENAGSVAGYYIKIGDDFLDKIALTFNPVPSETGIYYSIIDTSLMDYDNYMVVITATVDTVIANQVQYFKLDPAVALYGSGVYGNRVY